MPFLPVVGFPAVTTLHVYIKIIYSPCMFGFFFMSRSSEKFSTEETDRSIYCIGHLEGIRSFSCMNMLLFGSARLVLKIEINVQTSFKSFSFCMI